MFNLAKIKDVESKIRIIRDQKVILDSNVVGLYGVDNKRIKESVKNNQVKFP